MNWRKNNRMDGHVDGGWTDVLHNLQQVLQKNRSQSLTGGVCAKPSINHYFMNTADGNTDDTACARFPM